MPAGGRRLQPYDPDPETAPQVRQIFARRLAGRSTASIAQELNDDGVPVPIEERSGIGGAARV
jgi:hypothetical protein